MAFGQTGGPGIVSPRQLGGMAGGAITGQKGPMGQFQQGFQGLTIPGFPGPFTMPMNPFQQMAMGQAGQAFGGYDPWAALAPLQQIAGGARGGPGYAQELGLPQQGWGGLSQAAQELLTMGEEAERRRIGEEQAGLRQRAALQGTRRGVGTQRAEAELAARALEQGQAQRQALSAQMLGGEQQLMTQAALGLPGAFTQAFNPFTQAFNLGEAARQIGDVGLQRQMAEFARTQGALWGPLLGAGMGVPTQQGGGKGGLGTMGALMPLAGLIPGV